MRKFFPLLFFLFLSVFFAGCVELEKLGVPLDFTLPNFSSSKQAGNFSVQPPSNASLILVDNTSQYVQTNNESAPFTNESKAGNASKPNASTVLNERFYPDIEKDVFDAVNSERVKQGLPALSWADDVSSVSRNHSRDMGINGFFSHENLRGQTPFNRIDEAGIKYSAAGENLGLTYNYPNQVHEMVREWMNSPSHRKNILEPEYEESGIGVYKSLNGTYYYTQMFIKRPGWYEWVNQKVSIAPNAGYLFMRRGGDPKQFKYVVSSDYYFDAFWVPNEANASAAVNGGKFAQYSNCSKAKTKYYASPECLVPGDSGLVVINKNLVQINAEVKISYYS